MKKFRVSLFDCVTDNQPKEKAITWADWQTKAARPQIRAAKDGQLISGAIFRTDAETGEPRRAKINVTEVSIAFGDIDHGVTFVECAAKARALGCAVLLYTSHSHRRVTDMNPDAEDRTRIVIPLLMPIQADRYPAFWDWLQSALGGILDKNCKDSSRMVYTPAIASEDAPYETCVIDGDCLDWRALDLRATHAPEAQMLPAQSGQRRDAYGQAALASEVARVRAATNGSRNSTLNEAAFVLGQLVGAGALAVGEVEHALCGGAIGAGLPESEARRTIASGLSAGIREPRDLSRSAAAQSVPSVHSVHAPTKPEPWDLPVPFREFDLPAFPLDALSSWHRSYVEQLAEATQTPADLAAMQSISAIAATIARNVEIEARQGWREPLCIFTLTVAESANRKSAVVAEVTRPLERFEGDLLAEMREKIAEAVNERKILEARLEKAQKDCAKLAGAELAKRKAEAREIAIEIENHVIPVAPRFFVDDTTSEALASKMAEQGGRIALFSAEGGIFETMAGRYSNGAPNIDVYLKGHAGDSLRVDRRQRSERIERPALTIGLAVQSDVIRGLAQKPGFRGRGLLGRFLYSLPQSRLGSRKSRAKSISTEAAHTYERYLIRLAAIKPNEVEGGEPEPITLRLSGEADDYLAQFQDEVEPELAEGGEYATISEWAGKLCGAAVRLAGLLHCADHAANAPRIPGEVPAGTFKRAVEIARYLIPHSLAAHAEMGADPLIEDARYVLRWLSAGRLEDVSKRDIHRGCRRFKKITELDPVLALLEDHDYLRPLLPTGNFGTRLGRKASQIYAVNPALYLSGQKGQKGQNTPKDGNSVLSVLSVPQADEWKFEREPGQGTAEILPPVLPASPQPKPTARRMSL